MSVINYMQIILLILQVSSLVYCIVTGSIPLETHYGYSTWGFIPIVILSLFDLKV